ncbi:MAG TPA: DNA-3-methyladenine glycosylase [Acidimicrobiales bacterium]
MRPVPRSFFARDSRIVAPDLLNKLLVRGDRVGRIVEVEAYAGSEDPASHGFRGPTPRNEVMFGPAGHLYVYFTYGMHFCANAVCGMVGESSAVLLRALAPVEGLDEMRAARGSAARQDRDLCSGPAKLCQAFGIDRSQDGADLVGGEDVGVFDDGTPPPTVAGVSRRVGISVAVDEPWRWFVAGDPNVSGSPR